MKESIVIKNFGPIKKVVIDDIKPMTVFIGESGSGKSTIMKVLALFQWLYKMACIRSYLWHSNITKSPFRFRIDGYLKQNGMDSYKHGDTEIVYTNGSYVIAFKNNKLHGTTVIVPLEELSLEKIAFISDKRNLIPSLIENNMNTRKMFYLNETYEDYIKASEEIKMYDIDYLGVRFEVKKTTQGRKHFITSGISQDKDSESFSIKLRDSSSGIQNIVPLTLNIEYFTHHYDLVSSLNVAILNYLFKSDNLVRFRPVENVGKIAHKRVSVFVEEPELSLYPDAQLAMLDSIVSDCFVNGPTKYSMYLMMATHSPYIVNYLNVLLKRGKESGKAYIAAGELAVYCVHQGEVQNLMMQHNVTGEYYVNTMDLSDAMCAINNEYQMLKNKDTDVLDRE